MFQVNRIKWEDENSLAEDASVKEGKEKSPAKKRKDKSPPKRVNLAVVRRGNRMGPHAELMQLIDELKSEKQDLNDQIRSLTIAKDHLQGKVNKADKLEIRLREDIERALTQLKEVEGECSMLRTTCGRLEREQKQREISTKADAVRLSRQEEQLSQLRTEEKNLKATVKELTTELNNHKEMTRKQLNLKDKQIEQLVDGFQKQMQLIDVLRRQKLHLEAAHILQYTEDEFLQTLDWELNSNGQGNAGTNTNNDNNNNDHVMEENVDDEEEEEDEEEVEIEHHPQTVQDYGQITQEEDEQEEKEERNDDVGNHDEYLADEQPAEENNKEDPNDSVEKDVKNES